MDFASDEFYMGEALRLARKAFAAEEVPIGAVIVREGQIIARAWNQVEMLKDATAHAEMLAITQAESVVDDWRLNDCDLYVTKEPCPMCAGALVHARLRRVIFAASMGKAAAGEGFSTSSSIRSSITAARCRAGCAATSARAFSASFSRCGAPPPSKGPGKTSNPETPWPWSSG